MILKKMLALLTDNYAKNPESNIGKLFNCLSVELEEIKYTLEKIESWRSLDDARGTTLDRLGKNLDQVRGNLDDDSYRTLLKTKIKRNMSRGDINTIVEVFAAVLGVPIEAVKVEERFPAGLYIEAPYLEFETLLDSRSVVGEFMRGVIAAGVGLEINSQGTFEFGSAPVLGFYEPTFDEEKGFSDRSQELGGTLGGLYRRGIA